MFLTAGKSKPCLRTSVATDSAGTSIRTDQQRTSLTTDQQGFSLTTADQQGFSLTTADQQGSSLIADTAEGTSVEQDSQGASVANGDSQGTSIKINSGSEDNESTDSEVDPEDGSLKTEPEVAVGDGESPGTLTKRRGLRTTIRVQQLELLKQAFARNPKPMAMEKEQLRNLTGLDLKVIQVRCAHIRSVQL